MALKSKPLSEVHHEVPVERVSDPVRINLIVPDTVREHWKIVAIQRRMTLTDLIRRAMDEYLSKQADK